MNGQPSCFSCEKPTLRGGSHCFSCGSRTLVETSNSSVQKLVVGPIPSMAMRETAKTFLRQILPEGEPINWAPLLGDADAEIHLHLHLTQATSGALKTSLRERRFPHSLGPLDTKKAVPSHSSLLALKPIFLGSLGALLVLTSFLVEKSVSLATILAGGITLLASLFRHLYLEWITRKRRENPPQVIALPYVIFEEKADLFNRMALQLESPQAIEFQSVCKQMHRFLLRLLNEDDPVAYALGGIDGELAKTSVEVLERSVERQEKREHLDSLQGESQIMGEILEEWDGLREEGSTSFSSETVSRWTRMLRGEQPLKNKESPLDSKESHGTF